jgi:hypothetical protein
MFHSDPTKQKNREVIRNKEQPEINKSTKQSLVIMVFDGKILTTGDH